MKYLILSLMCFFLISTASCKQKEGSAQKEIIRPVKFEKVRYFDGRKIVKLSCIVEPESAQNMSFKISGKITKLTVQAGDIVAVGDVIAELDDETQKLNVLEAKAGVKKETSQLDAARLNYDQIKSLYENDTVSLSQYQQAETQLQSSKSGLVSAKKRLEKLEIDLADTRLVSQVSGVVAEVYKDVNESVSVGQSLATIYSGNEIVVKLNLPDNIINKVSKGTKAELFFPNSEKQNYKGVISEVSISGSSSSLTYPAKVEIEDSDTSLKVGMTGNTSIYLGKASEKSKKIIIPISAVTKDTKSSFVYVLESVVNNIGLVKKVYVSLGDVSNEGIVIKGGLTTNDLLITAGLSKITEGQKVKVNF
jgi:membrane fusion protein, multidrug efflux system